MTFETMEQEEFSMKHNRAARPLIALVCSAVLGVLTLAMAAPARADEEATQLQAVLDKRAPSVVTVKVVLKSQGPGAAGSAESRLEVQGVLVDKTGLVMIPNTAFSSKHLRAVMNGPGGADQAENETPTDIKVIFENEDKEYDAFLAATDTSMDLAFLKIENLANHPVTPVDFSTSTPPAIGDRLVTVSRLRRGYDYSPYFDTLRVSGAINKPRKAWLVDGNIPSYGMPVYTLAGDLAGVLTTVEQGTADESPDTLRFAVFLHAWGGAGAPIPTFLVPGTAVQGLISLAETKAAQIAAERTKNPPPAAPPAAPPAPAPKNPAHAGK